MTYPAAPASPPSAADGAPLVFIVDDDAEITRLLELTLQEYGYATRAWTQGTVMLRRLAHERPDLCIVDLGLPDIEGLELVRQIRAISNTGLLILSVRSHMADRVMGLELGSDDYMAKPFEPRELVARVRSILRRRGAPGGDPGQRRVAGFLGWQFDLAANLLRSPDGEEQLLGTAESQVLRVFVERPHQILTREQLVGSRDLPPQDRSIDVRISRLRRRLEPDATRPTVIKTVYGAGYLFTPHVSWQ